MKQIDITVCLTTYKRPYMLKQAMESFVVQPYKNAELLIIDDCPEDLVTKKIVNKLQHKDKRIRYIKNKRNIGFSKNLFTTLTKAKGKYLYLLGDDDCILGENTLEKYIDIFKKNPSVDFVYSNIVQFNNNLSVDYFYNHFSKSHVYRAGRDAIENIWLKSMYIGGIGLRKSSKIDEYYPKDSTLFPIVELIGKLLLEKGAYGLSSISIGMRVHADQLGVHVMQKKRITEKEKHGYQELYRIADRLESFIKEKKLPISPAIILNTINTFLRNADTTILLAEGLKVGKSALLHTILQSKKEEKRIFHTPQFWMQLLVILIVPTFFLEKVKYIYIFFLRKTYWRNQVDFFNHEINRIIINSK